MIVEDGNVPDGYQVTIYCANGFTLVGGERNSNCSNGKLEPPLGRCQQLENSTTSTTTRTTTTTTKRTTTMRTMTTATMAAVAAPMTTTIASLSGSTRANVTRVLDDCQLRALRRGSYYNGRDQLLISNRVASGTRVSLICDDGYRVNGYDTATCNDGLLQPKLGWCDIGQTTTPFPSVTNTTVKGNASSANWEPNFEDGSLTIIIVTVILLVILIIFMAVCCQQLIEC